MRADRAVGRHHDPAAGRPDDLLALGVCLGAIGRLISMAKVGVPEPPALWIGYAASELILPLIIVVAHFFTGRHTT